MATDSGGTRKKKKTTGSGGTGHEASLGTVPSPPDLQVYKTGYWDPARDAGLVDPNQPGMQSGPYPAQAPDPYTTGSGTTADYVGNSFLDNPGAAVNNIMQGLGLSVSSNSPFYNAMSQLAPGLEWMQYFGSGTGAPGEFLGNVGSWFNQGTGGNAMGANLGGMLQNFFSGGNTADLSAMIDNMTPEDITRAIASMMETGMYGSAGSRVRQGLQSRLLDQYNQFAGNQPTIEAGLGAGQTIADAFLEWMRGKDVLGSLGF
jgi:hypothetical protein